MGRFELKFFMHRERLKAFLGALSVKARPDPITGAYPYRVNSLYFDSKDFFFYFQNIDGEPYRKKLRIRHYGDFESGKNRWFEIKEKQKTMTLKRRVKTDVSQEESFLRSDEGVESLSAVDARVRSEMMFLMKSYKLQPVAYTSYERRAFLDPAEERVRVTVDTDLVGIPYVKDGNDFERAQRVIPGEVCIVEMKGPRRLPLWLVDAVRDFQLRRSKMSKYCTVVQQCVR